MFKTSNKKISRTFLLSMATLTLVVFLSSCQGFMNGEQARNKIKDAIAYSEAPFYKININYVNGTGKVKAPAGGQASKKVTDIFTVSFAPAKEYEFLYWTLVDGRTGQELADGEYLELASLTESETTCSFIKAPPSGVELCLKPVIIKRPVSIFWGPENTAMGVKCDEPIQVMFDQDMHENSIYYTKDERDVLEDIPDIEFLCVTVGGVEKTYGYKIGDDDSTIVFKNIKVVDNNNEKINLLCYFENPVFADPRQLKISVQKKNNKALLPSGTMLKVTIEKDFFCIPPQYDKHITLPQAKIYPYFVSDNVSGN